MEVDGPLASNIVRNFEIANLTALEILSDNVIGIDIAETQLVIIVGMPKKSYRSPRCKSPTPFGRIKQWRAQTALTTPLAI